MLSLYGCTFASLTFNENVRAYPCSVITCGYELQNKSIPFSISSKTSSGAPGPIAIRGLSLGKLANTASSIAARSCCDSPVSNPPIIKPATSRAAVWVAEAIRRWVNLAPHTAPNKFSVEFAGNCWSVESNHERARSTDFLARFCEASHVTSKYIEEAISTFVSTINCAKSFVVTCNNGLLTQHDVHRGEEERTWSHNSNRLRICRRTLFKGGGISHREKQGGVQVEETVRPFSILVKYFF